MTTILYIPGLGDGYDRFRRGALRLWMLYGVRAKLVPITWYDGGDFETKYRLVTQAVTQTATGRVVVIGESAGATLALHAAADPQLRITKVITLCGVTRRTTPISPYLRRRAPALDDAVRHLPEGFKTPIISLRAVFDHVVGRRSSVAIGATEHVVWSVGHLFTIMLCLTLLAPFLVRLARQS